MGRYRDPMRDVDRDAASHGYHDPLEYWDRLPGQLEQLQSNMLLGMNGSRAVDGSKQPDLGDVAEDLVTVAGLAVRSVFLLVTWPVRWAWRRRKQN